MIKDYLEIAALQPTVSEKQILEYMDKAVELQASIFCVPPYWVKKVKRDLGNVHLRLSSVVGYPFGYSRTEVKLEEIRILLAEGVDEIEVSVNLSAFKSDVSGWAKVELAQIAKLVHEHGVILKAIIESPLLGPGELEKCCRVCVNAGVDIISLTSGIHANFPSHEDILIAKTIVPATVGIKTLAKSIKEVEELKNMGVERIGLNM